MKKSILLAFTTLIYLATPSIIKAESISSTLYPVILNCFPSAPEDSIHITELKGGLSQSALYKVKIDDKPYVLRVLQSGALNDQDALELFCLKEAAKIGLSPFVIYTSPDNKMILMEFIEGKTLTIDQANITENVVKIAKTLTEAHQITGHPMDGESLLSKARRCCPMVLDYNLRPANEITHAYQLVKSYSRELGQYDYTKVHVHGDLNPRNIFLTKNRVYLIDWAETTTEDPFYDLTYFSLKLNYNRENERLLLTSYLERPPTEEEWDRFNLNKKIHQAFWSLTNLYLADAELKKHPEQKIDAINPIQEWGIYQKAFAEDLELPAQYFYDLSRLNYRLAL